MKVNLVAFMVSFFMALPGSPRDMGKWVSVTMLLVMSLIFG